MPPKGPSKNQGAKIGISTQKRCRSIQKWIYLLKFLLMQSIAGLLYNFLIHLARIVMRIAGLFHEKTGQKIRHEKNWKFLKDRDPERPLIWFHCASLGEFEQGRPVMERFRKQNPDWQILLTFFSPSGYQVRKNYEGADLICYLPFDLPAEVNTFLDFYGPELAVFVKYEFWRNFSKALRQRAIPLISISTILRGNQYFFKPWGGFGRRTLQNFSHFFVQNQETFDLLHSIGIDRVSIAGDTRFDRVADTLRISRDVVEVEKFKGDAKLMVCGSVWEEDMEVLVSLMSDVGYLTSDVKGQSSVERRMEKRERRKGAGVKAEAQTSDLKPQASNLAQLKLVIAPHEINQKQIDGWIAQLEKPCLKFSEITPQTDLGKIEVLFIDSIGLLSSLYRYGDFAFIGGAYGKGLHNILEAATFGMPIFFGDKAFHKFQEATDLIEQKSAFAVAKSSELTAKLNYFLSRPNELEKASLTASQYVKNHTGATDVVLNWIENKILRH